MNDPVAVKKIGIVASRSSTNGLLDELYGRNAEVIVANASKAASGFREKRPGFASCWKNC